MKIYILSFTISSTMNNEIFELFSNSNVLFYFNNFKCSWRVLIKLIYLSFVCSALTFVNENRFEVKFLYVIDVCNVFQCRKKLYCIFNSFTETQMYFGKKISFAFVWFYNTSNTMTLIYIIKTDFYMFS